jgi:lipoprotein-anchoring transpeptidase ErfK/SrfK
VHERDGKRARPLDVERALVAAILHPTARSGIVVRRRVWHASRPVSRLGPAIVISRAGHFLRLYGVSKRGRTVIRRTFQVATGQSAYPTPAGLWSIVQMWRNPWWYPPDSPWAQGLKPIPPGPGNPLGTRWMGLSASGVGIHGTPDDASIGYSASHGCIRMHVPDAEYLFTQVSIGVPVLVI